MRRGILSDESIKFNYAEFFPLDIGSGEAFSTTNLDHHIYTGIKSVKNKKLRQTHSRIPLYDIQNYSQLGAPARKQEATFNGVMNYRKNIGSPNFTPNLEIGYKMRQKAGTAPLIPHELTEQEKQAIANEPSASLTLKYRDIVYGTAQVYHSKATTNTPLQYQFSPKQRHFLGKITDSQDEYVNLLNSLQTGKKQTNEEILEKLQKMYRNNTDDIKIIEKAWNETKMESLRPEMPEMSVPEMPEMSQMPEEEEG
jgi:hypothetical protein